MCHWAVLLSELIHEPAEVVISGSEALELRQRVHTNYLPFIITLGATKESDLTLLKDRPPRGNDTVIYVCYNKTCQLPTTSLETAMALLRNS